MKVEVNTQALAEATAWTTRVIPSRPASPILSGVKLEAFNGVLQLSAFDYEISSRHHIEAGIDEPGTVIVLGKLLTDIVKSLPEEVTTLQTDDTRLTISSGKTSFILQLMPEQDYPDLPLVPPTLGTIDGQVFANAITQASVAVAREENRPVLTGIHMQFTGEQVVLTATDRFRLSRATFNWTPQNPDIAVQTLVRGSYLKDIARSLNTAQDITLDFAPDAPTLMGFENDGRSSTVQLIDGEFPTVDRLFADEYPIHAVIEKQLLLDAIRRVALVAERNAPIRMAFNGSEVSLSASGDEQSGHDVLPVDLDGNEIMVAFNPTYLVEGLSAIREPYVRMKMTDSLKAVEFNGQQEATGDESLAYRYLLVPMRSAE